MILRVIMIIISIIIMMILARREAGGGREGRGIGVLDMVIVEEGGRYLTKLPFFTNRYLGRGWVFDKAPFL